MMEITAVEILHNERDGQHTFGLDRATRDALATYLRLRWPVGTAKATAREFDLTLDEARNMVAARSSLTGIDKIWKHPKGGWTVLLPVMGAVIGHGIDHYLEARRREHEAHAARLAEMAGLSRIGPRPPDPAADRVAPAEPDRPDADRRRESTHRIR